MADTSAQLGDRRRLLAFGPPSTSGIPPREGPSPYRPVHTPGGARQGTRLTPQFRSLQDALIGERAQLTETTEAPDPELVAVFDLAGTVDGFMRACREVEGLEFLADLQEDRVAADDDFYFEEAGGPAEDDVPQSLYMVMSNARAVDELVRLFELWQNDRSIRFATGLNPLKSVFDLLRGVRRWGPEDRVRETGLLEQWREDLEFMQTGPARVEIELWYRDRPELRASAQAAVEAIIVASGGHVVGGGSAISEIGFHGLLADIPRDQVQSVLEGGPTAIELLTTESIMFVTPAQRVTVGGPELEAPPLGTLEATEVTGLPRVALLDGLPFANHAALRGRLSIDDPDDMATRYDTGRRGHGTGMASLIIHGDLSAPGVPISGPLYVRPILEPHEFVRSEEVFPPDELMVDLLHRAFHRMFEGDGRQAAAAPGVRVVNISIGDSSRTFVRRLSPLARLIDWMSHKYNVLVVVSAGNHPMSPSIAPDALDDPELVRQLAAQGLRAEARRHRLLSPAESVNAITVGAHHSDSTSTELAASVVDAFDIGGPANYSATGFGFRRSVKPDVLLPGGREIFLRPLAGAETVLEIARTEATGPGIRVAVPGDAGSLTSTAFTRGTSNSAALATRRIDAIYEALEHLEADPDEFDFPDAQFHPVLAKTLLVHAARWGDAGITLRRRLELPSRIERRELTQLLGYGPVDEQRVATADRVRALLIGAGAIRNNKRATFRLPLPPVLAASTQWRRLTITLGWLSQINPRSQIYRMARLRFQPPRSELGVSPLEAEYNAVSRGTVQHEVLEGRAAVAFASGDSLAVDVDCRVDAGPLVAPVRFGLAVSIEVAASVQADLHEQVRQGLRQQVRERAQERVGVR